MVNIKFTHGSANDIPCKRDCEVRWPGCHTECEKYLAWKEAHEEQRRKIIKNRKHQSEATGFFVAIARKEKKKRKEK